MAVQRRFCIIWLVLIFSCAGADQPAEAKRTGEAIFKKHCVLCHGTDGKKGFAGAGDLTLSVINHDQVVKIISEGKKVNPGKVMTPFGGVLSKEEIERVAKYVESIRE